MGENESGARQGCAIFCVALGELSGEGNYHSLLHREQKVLWCSVPEQSTPFLETQRLSLNTLKRLWHLWELLKHALLIYSNST